MCVGVLSSQRPLLIWHHTLTTSYLGALSIIVGKVTRQRFILLSLLIYLPVWHKNHAFFIVRHLSGWEKCQLPVEAWAGDAVLEDNPLYWKRTNYQDRTETLWNNFFFVRCKDVSLGLIWLKAERPIVRQDFGGTEDTGEETPRDGEQARHAGEATATNHVAAFRAMEMASFKL